MEEKLRIVYTTTLQRKGVVLSPPQNELFIHACKLSIQDHLTTSDAIVAAGIYLNFVLSFPTMTLPPLKDSAETAI